MEFAGVVVEFLNVVFKEVIVTDVGDGEDDQEEGGEVEREEAEPELWVPDGEIGGEGEKDEGERAEEEGDDEVDEALVLKIAEHPVVVEGEVAVRMLGGFFDEVFVVFDALFHMLILSHKTLKPNFPQRSSPRAGPGKPFNCETPI